MKLLPSDIEQIKTNITLMEEVDIYDTESEEQLNNGSSINHQQQTTSINLDIEKEDTSSLLSETLTTTTTIDDENNNADGKRTKSNKPFNLIDRINSSSLKESEISSIKEKLGVYQVPKEYEELMRSAMSKATTGSVYFDYLCEGTCMLVANRLAGKLANIKIDIPEEMMQDEQGNKAKLNAVFPVFSIFISSPSDGIMDNDPHMKKEEIAANASHLQWIHGVKLIDCQDDVFLVDSYTLDFVRGGFGKKQIKFDIEPVWLEQAPNGLNSNHKIVEIRMDKNKRDHIEGGKGQEQNELNDIQEYNPFDKIAVKGVERMKTLLALKLKAPDGISSTERALFYNYKAETKNKHVRDILNRVELSKQRFSEDIIKKVGVSDDWKTAKKDVENTHPSTMMAGLTLETAEVLISRFFDKDTIKDMISKSNAFLDLSDKMSKKEDGTTEDDDDDDDDAIEHLDTTLIQQDKQDMLEQNAGFASVAHEFREALEENCS